METNTESSDSHSLTSLRAQHAALEREIADESARPRPDDTHIGEMKRQKLRIKDQLAALEKKAA